MQLGGELDGITVISIEQAVAAPYCGLLLADAGARVIKVERPEGDFARRYDSGAGGESSIFAWLNRGKESIAMDINNPEDSALLRRLLASADVLISNLAPGALARRGFTASALQAINPKLICCEITGYGSDGEGASKKAYDFLVQAESGICAVTGTPDHPSRVGISVCDIGTGITAFSAILRALIKQGRTGLGCEISISMFDVMADWMNMPLAAHRYMGTAPARLGLTHALIAPYGAFKSQEGNEVLIAIQSNREWQIFCDKILSAPAFGTDPRFVDNVDRVKNRDALHAIINNHFNQTSRDALINSLNQAKIACAQLSEVEDLSVHQFLRNVPAVFGETTINVADLPVKIEGDRHSLVPKIDQHGNDIRREFL